MALEEQSTATQKPAHWFTTTHWSVVLAARQHGSPQSDDALQQLCRTYWYPLYAYARRRGNDPHSAQDLIQEFYARLLDGNSLQDVDAARGRFRSFLLASLNHFLANEHDRAQALKRGGRCTIISLDDDTAEGRYQLEPVDTLTPEVLYERRWARTVLESALRQLHAEFTAAKKGAQFERLKNFLEGDVGAGAYNVAAAELGMNPNSVAVAVHRLRHRYRELIELEIAQTVATPEAVAEELRHLLSVLVQ
jgi:RNA polymerase sigma-70 factor (ECF subfamily)